MSVIVGTIVDQYPMETLSFDNLSQDSPISYLDYGGILSQIGELVRQKRKENREQRRDYLIKKINNINLGILIDKIKLEAQHLESYRAKEWNKGPSTKTNYKKFFQSHDISLKYLEDMYEVQSKGKPVIELNTLIKIKSNSYTDAEYGETVLNIIADRHRNRWFHKFELTEKTIDELTIEDCEEILKYPIKINNDIQVCWGCFCVYLRIFYFFEYPIAYVGDNFEVQYLHHVFLDNFFHIY